MSTATKLEYLNTTKEKIRDSINLTGANIGTSDTFRSYASKLKKGYIDIINNGIDTLYNNFPKVSGIGSNLSLTPTYEAPMKLNEIQGNTLQENTPTPSSPVPIQSVTGLQNVNVCGKNLFSSEMELGTLNNSTGLPATETNCIRTKDYISVNPSTTYIISNNKGYQQIVYQYDSSYNLIVANTQNSSFTTTSTTKYIKLRTGVSNVENDLTSLWQLEKGSTATTYEPYTGNTYEVNLGKNLLPNIATTTTKNGITFTKNSDGTYTVSGTATANAVFSILTEGDLTNLTLQTGTYTLSGCPSGGSGNTYKLDISVGSYNQDTGSGVTFTLSEATQINYVRILVYSGQTINAVFKPMLEKGSQATSYSPYFTPIELNKIGDYQDRIYKDNGKWYLEKNIGKVVLTGASNENWAQNSSQTQTNTNYFSSNVIDNLLKSGEKNGVSNYFIVVNELWNTDIEGIQFSTSSSNIRLRINKTIASNLATFKTWLSTHNTEVLYVLANPTYIEITNTELIEDLETLYTAKSQEGTTNISITSEDLEMILNVSALKGEV